MLTIGGRLNVCDGKNGRSIIRLERKEGEKGKKERKKERHVRGGGMSREE